MVVRQSHLPEGSKRRPDLVQQQSPVNLTVACACFGAFELDVNRYRVGSPLGLAWSRPNRNDANSALHDQTLLGANSYVA
jgi:hypothetical protein